MSGERTEWSGAKWGSDWTPALTFGAAVRACRQHFLAAFLFSAALNLLYLAPSLFMMQVYDRVLVSGGMTTLAFLSLALLACLVTSAALDATRARLLAAASGRIDRLLAPSVLGAPFSPGVNGARARGALRELDVCRGALSGPAALAVMDAPWTPLYVGVCFIVHPWLGGLALGGGAALLAIAACNEIALRRALRGSEETSAAMYATHQADAVHAGPVRALGMRHELVDRQLDLRAAFVTAQNRAARAGAGYVAASKFMRQVLQSAALALGAYLAVRQQISAGSLIACTLLTARALAPIEQIVAAWRSYGQTAHALNTVRDVLSEAAASDRRYTRLPALTGEVSVEAATIAAASGERLVQGVSFRLHPGEILGVAGPSGAGKSTLLAALVGATPLHQGVIRLDGAQLSDWDPDILGRSIGYLPQGLALCAGTVAENISRFQSREETEAVDYAVVTAAMQAGVHDLILRLPYGYETPLGPDGRGVSTGQAQRIALARALYGDPNLIVLDEPNAHLDAEGENALMAALKEARQRGASIIVVAHRAGLMSIADKILVLRDGRAEAFGPRDEIMGAITAGAAPSLPGPLTELARNLSRRTS